MQKTRPKTKTIHHSRSNGRRRAPVKKNSVRPACTQIKEQDFEHFKSLVIEMRDETVRELDVLSESLTQEAVTIGEQPDEPPESMQTVLMIHRQRKLLHSLEAALVRIEQRTYGTCSSCGNPIDKGRLEAIPYATLCVECGRGKQE